jgi:hypothetical protein
LTENKNEKIVVFGKSFFVENDKRIGFGYEM